ncbi:sugar transferase [Blastococcus sp. TF02A-30]|uniref:sugar transferase n=1 Tax=Blastococcus sp. TF02A-30 TaxID=2250580 RepID=UPI001F3DFBAC|nr:sugar transferase [Blastococcus sp. TF02A-30]
MVADILCAVVAGLAAYLIRFGANAGTPVRTSLLPVLLLPLVWGAAMLVSRAYEQRYLWLGPEEFRRVFNAAAMLLAALGTISWAFKLELARGFVVVAVPLAALLTLLQRYGQRRLLHAGRRRGNFQQTMMIVGHRSAVAALREQIDREAHHGYRVVGCCLPDGHALDNAEAFDGIPVLGSLDDVAAMVREHQVDAVAVMPCPELDGPTLRRLGWDLEKTRAELLLAPAVTDVVGSRVSIRPVCGLPLLHMERPELTGVRRLTKELFDRSAAFAGILLLMPVLLGLAVAVKSTSRGPVLYKQERVGRDGRTFSMLKFRSMVVDADRMVGSLVAESEGNEVLFKMKADPRVTRVGKVLRRYSLDELPQLINVLRGEMSLVGPRPPLPTEVERYGFDMHRRFLVKPGLTGLWQVSGRSDLSWDDSVRIDVRYVENWSLTFDFMILWKTLGAVLRGSGAY